MADSSSGIVWAAIVPHGPDVVLEITKDPQLMAETRAAMEEAGRRMAAARVDTLILLDPWLVHSQNKFDQRMLYRGPGEITVGAAPFASGVLGQTRERYACDETLAQGILEGGRAAGFAVTPAALEQGELPIVWGATIPLWFLLRPLPEPRPRLVVIAPSPAVPREQLMGFGRFLAQVAGASGKRVALVASADHGHTHDRNHKRFGYSPAAAQYDALYCEAVRANELDRLMTIGEAMLVDSWSDSLWPTLVLAGALQAAPLRVDFRSYALPSYYGMVVAVYEP